MKINADIGQVPPFDYMIMLVNYASQKRKIPWSVPWTDIKIINKGPMDAGRIRRSTELMLVWDGIFAFYTNGEPAANQFWNKDSTDFKYFGVTRHGGGPKVGPNCLFADGHVQQKIDWTPLKKTLGAKADEPFTLLK